MRHDRRRRGAVRRQRPQVGQRAVPSGRPRPEGRSGVPGVERWFVHTSCAVKRSATTMARGCARPSAPNGVPSAPPRRSGMGRRSSTAWPSAGLPGFLHRGARVEQVADDLLLGQAHLGPPVGSWAGDSLSARSATARPASFTPSIAPMTSMIPTVDGRVAVVRVQLDDPGIGRQRPLPGTRLAAGELGERGDREVEVPGSRPWPSLVPSPGSNATEQPAGGSYGREPRDDPSRRCSGRRRTRQPIPRPALGEDRVVLVEPPPARSLTMGPTATVGRRRRRAPPERRRRGLARSRGRCPPAEVSHREEVLVAAGDDLVGRVAWRSSQVVRSRSSIKIMRDRSTSVKPLDAGSTTCCSTCGSSRGDDAWLDDVLARIAASTPTSSRCTRCCARGGDDALRAGALDGRSADDGVQLREALRGASRRSRTPTTAVDLRHCGSGHAVAGRRPAGARPSIADPRSPSTSGATSRVRSRP